MAMYFTCLYPFVSLEAAGRHGTTLLGVCLTTTASTPEARKGLPAPFGVEKDGQIRLENLMRSAKPDGRGGVRFPIKHVILNAI